MDSGWWFIVLIVAVVFGWGAWQRRSEIDKVEGDPIMVDVGEQEYRVRFSVKPKQAGVIAHWTAPNNDALIASVDARTPTGWRHVGEWTSDFRYGEYGQYGQINITNDKSRREYLAKMAVEHVTEPKRRW